MDKRIRELMEDLEQYIQENWIAPDEDDIGEEMPCEKSQSHPQDTEAANIGGQRREQAGF